MIVGHGTGKQRPCPPHHYIRNCIGRDDTYFCFPRCFSYRGLLIVARQGGGWRVWLDGTIIACPTWDGEDHQWDVNFPTVKEAKMGIDRYISWQVIYLIGLKERRA